MAARHRLRISWRISHRDRRLNSSSLSLFDGQLLGIIRPLAGTTDPTRRMLAALLITAGISLGCLLLCGL
jgi:hypothetical protein